MRVGLILPNAIGGDDDDDEVIPVVAEEPEGWSLAAEPWRYINSDVSRYITVSVHRNTSQYIRCIDVSVWGGLEPRATGYTAGYYINTPLFLMYWAGYITCSDTAGHYINIHHI